MKSADIEVENRATYRKSHAIRLSSHDYASETPVHLILCALEGAPFTDAAISREVCSAIEFTCQRLGFLLYAYCLMPDHLHVLVSPGSSETHVSQWLQRFKSYTTRVWQEQSGCAELWQRSARDRVVRDREPLHELAAYIVNNPLRKGLVDNWSAWPYSKLNVS